MISVFRDVTVTDWADWGQREQLCIRADCAAWLSWWQWDQKWKDKTRAILNEEIMFLTNWQDKRLNWGVIQGGSETGKTVEEIEISFLGRMSLEMRQLNMLLLVIDDLGGSSINEKKGLKTNLKVRALPWIFHVYEEAKGYWAGAYWF